MFNGVVVAASRLQAMPRRRPIEWSCPLHWLRLLLAPSSSRKLPLPDAWLFCLRRLLQHDARWKQLQPHFAFHPLIANTHHLTLIASLHRPAFLLFLCHISFHIPGSPTPTSSPPRCSSPPVAIHYRHFHTTRATTHPPCQKAYNKTRSYSTMTRKRRARSASRSSTSPTRASSLVLVATRLVPAQPTAFPCDSTNK
jgi:hypothetical protein